MNDEMVEIKSGLQAGELVVVAPETSLKDGVRVKAIERYRTPTGQLPAGD